MRSPRSRRTVLAALLGGALLCAGTSARAQAPNSVHVVKILSFGCPVCLMSEGIDAAIASAVSAAGGRFVPAPVPTGDDTVGNKERVYYAARDLNAAWAEPVKRSLYRGAQEVQVPLSDMMQVYTWLQQDLPSLEPHLGPVFQRAQSNEARDAMFRAARLALNAGVTKLPAYLVVHNGRTVAALDPSSVPGQSFTALRDEVIARVQKAASTP